MKSSSDPFQHFSMQMKVLDFFGLSFRIPYSKKSLYFWLGVVSRMCLGFFFFVIPTGTQIVYLTRLILSGKSELLTVVTILNLLMTEILVQCKLLDMCLRRDKLEQMFDLLTAKEFHVTSEPHRLISDGAVGTSRRLFLLFSFTASITVLFHVVVVPALDRFNTLPLKMDFIFFDVNDPKYFKFVCAYQILYKPGTVGVFVMLFSLPWSAMSFTISQLDILIYNLENMKYLVKETKTKRGCNEYEAFRQIFRGCVVHHFAIKRFINTLQAVFSLQLAWSLFLNSAIIGTTAMQLLSIESPMKNFTEVFWVVTFMTSFILMLFLDCSYGEAITEKSAYLSTKVYECPWTNLDKDLKKSIIIFLANTQQPVVISAATLTPVSLKTFTKVMNWTYKGFAVLNQTQ